MASLLRSEDTIGLLSISSCSGPKAEPAIPPGTEKPRTARVPWSSRSPFWGRLGPTALSWAAVRAPGLEAGLRPCCPGPPTQRGHPAPAPHGVHTASSRRPAPQRSLGRAHTEPPGVTSNSAMFFPSNRLSLSASPPPTAALLPLQGPSPAGGVWSVSAAEGARGRWEPGEWTAALGVPVTDGDPRLSQGPRERRAPGLAWA